MRLASNAMQGSTAIIWDAKASRHGGVERKARGARRLTLSKGLDRAPARRRFTRFLAASPLLAHCVAPALAQNIGVARLPDPMVWAPRQPDSLISDPKEALDVFDFEPVAKKNVPPAHFGYMVTGIDDEVTLRANREGFLKFH